MSLCDSHYAVQCQCDSDGYYCQNVGRFPFTNCWCNANSPTQISSGTISAYDGELSDSSSSLNKPEYQCYGYSNTITFDNPYTCPGHRNYLSNSSINVPFNEFVDHASLCVIQQTVKNEILQRKQHLMYSNEPINYNDSNVTSNDIATVKQPNNIKIVIDKLRKRIEQLSDYAVSSQQKYTDVDTQKFMLSNQITPLSDEINIMWQDCICFSDCISYCQWVSYGCNCNTNCICNY